MIQNGQATAPVNGIQTHERLGQTHERLVDRANLKVAYMMSRFPKITETFILYEMLAMEQHGVQIEVYPLQREKTNVVHPEARSFVARANFRPMFTLQMLRSHGRFFRRKPLTYLHTLWTLVRANFGSPRYLAGSLAFFPKAVHFAELMEKDGITHLHAHFASFPAAVAYVIHRLTNIPYSFTGHGSDLNRDRHMLKEKVMEASTVVPISEFFKEMIVDECGEIVRHKIQVVHCGVDTAVFEPRTEPTPFDRGEADFMLLAIGTLHEVKGQKYLIQACAELKKQGIAFTCHFIGDGPDEEMLAEETRRLGLEDVVHFHGRQPREFVVDMLKKTDVLVTPSVPSSDGRREGIPVVLMEGMGSCVPVISTRMSGIPELVEDGECGYLVEPFAVDQLADRIQKLHADADLRHQFGQAGRKKVVEEFDLYANAVKLAQYFSRGKGS